MALGFGSFVLGLFAWTFVEYVIHGFLSHRFQTFATPLHDAHHRDPHAVFTVGAWIPVALATAAILATSRFGLGTVFWLGLVAGFALYEAEHYRMHFCAPACRYEARLRLHHLAHHHGAPDACFGVTNRLWDRVFATEPERSRMEALEASVAAAKPLIGPTNARLALRPWLFLPGSRS